MKLLPGYWAVLGLMVSLEVMAFDEAAALAAARQAAETLVSQLKRELVAAMEQGGPVAAIEVCQRRAPAIAAEVSQHTGLEVYRTSLKPRARQPDAWDREVLQGFDARVAAGEAAAGLEAHAIVEEDGQSLFRFAKALPVQGLCLQCHGQTLAPPVAERLRALYPEDQALGYRLGEVRGAVGVRQGLP